MNTICMETHALAIGYHSRAAKTIASGLNLSLRNGQLTCLVGPNGSGQIDATAHPGRAAKTSVR